MDLTGGQTQDGGSAIGASVFYAESCRQTEEEEEGKMEVKESKESMVWIGSSTHSCSKVTVIDANYPQNILDCFMICTSHLLCITAVPGACQADYDTDSDSVADSVTDTPKTDQGGFNTTFCVESLDFRVQSCGHSFLFIACCCCCCCCYCYCYCFGGWEVPKISLQNIPPE